MSQDSYKGSAYQPWTQHLYTYCGNNPVNLIDPTGHWPKWLNGGAIKTAIGVTAAAVGIAAIIVATGGVAAVPLIAAVGATIGTTSVAVATTATVVAAGSVALAGSVAATQGVFDMVEGATGKNALKEKVFKGNDYLYYGVGELTTAYSFLGASYLAPYLPRPILPKKLSKLPKNVQDSYKKYDKNGWKGKVSGQTPKTKAGGNYRNADGKLPSVDKSTGNQITYKEFDVNNEVGLGRDAQRFVVGNNGVKYYTSNHYRSFRRLLEWK